MRHVLAAVTACALAAIATAQNGNHKNEFSVWGGYSPDSTTAISIFGRTRDAKFGIVSLRYARRFKSSRWMDLKYTADLTPVAALRFSVPNTSPGQKTTVYGFGGAPLGIQANFRPRKRVQPFAGLAGGVLYFNRRVPGEFGRRFAYTADIGGGVDIQTSEHRSISIGYKYFHVSNGNRGEINPGIDNNLFYVGYTLFSK